MANLGYLLYSSTATRWMNPQELTDILERCRVENGIQEITGMLLFKDGCFMQILEGEQDQIRELYEKISKDPRHDSVVEIASDPIRERSFSDWSMGFVDMDQVIPDAPEYEKYFETNFTLRSFSEDAQSATLFIRSFNRLSKIVALAAGARSDS